MIPSDHLFLSISFSLFPSQHTHAGPGTPSPQFEFTCRSPARTICPSPTARVPIRRHSQRIVSPTHFRALLNSRSSKSLVADCGLSGHSFIATHEVLNSRLPRPPPAESGDLETDADSTVSLGSLATTGQGLDDAMLLTGTLDSSMIGAKSPADLDYQGRIKFPRHRKEELVFIALVGDHRAKQQDYQPGSQVA